MVQRQSGGGPCTRGARRACSSAASVEPRAPTGPGGETVGLDQWRPTWSAEGGGQRLVASGAVPRSREDLEATPGARRIHPPCRPAWSLEPGACCLLPAACCLLPASCCPQRCLLPAAPTAPAAFTAACCLLPTHGCLLPPRLRSQPCDLPHAWALLCCCAGFCCARALSSIWLRLRLGFGLASVDLTAGG